MASWVEQLGTFNPQFLRECRGRLKPRSVLATVGLSLIAQILLYLAIMDNSYQSREQSWLNLAQTLSWLMPYALFVIGGFFIVDDLAREEKRGTLNFIRLSPRPAREILSGKLMGAPLLPILLVVTAVPLHVYASIATNRVSPLWLVSYYALLIVGSGLVFSLALLFGLVGSGSSLAKQQTLAAVAFAGLALVVITPLFMWLNSDVTWNGFGQLSPFFNPYGLASAQYDQQIYWLGLPLSTNALVGSLFAIGNLLIGTVLTWQVLLRKFRIPSATLLSKRVSYVLVAYVNVVIWGFLQTTKTGSLNDRLSGAAGWYVINAGLFLALVFALAPSRQMLLDWLRYRRTSLSDWIWNDSSPSILAVAINFIIAIALIVPWALIVDFGDEPLPIGRLLLATLSVATLSLIYATLVQLIYSMRLRMASIWAVGIVATIIFVPWIVIGILNPSGSRAPIEIAIWTFIGAPIWSDIDTNITLGIAMGLMMQVVVLLLLLTRLARNLQQLSKRQATSLTRV
ncbi:MAG: hypothetical protein AAFR58_11460 [Cyanobacteria bacterium J06627_28]